MNTNFERDTQLELFNDILNETHSEDVERSCYRVTVLKHKISNTNSWKIPQFVMDYSAECNRIMNILEQNETVLRKVKYNKKFRCNIATYTTYELVPDLHLEEREKINSRLEVKIDLKVSTRYKCKRCGHNETTLMEYQARSADEASTLSIKCVKCEHTWRK